MSISISREWQELDLDGPDIALVSFRERIAREIRDNNALAEKLRRDEKDAAEQAHLHEQRAIAYQALLNTLP